MTPHESRCAAPGRARILSLTDLMMEALEFSPTGEYIELHQLLKLAGVCASGGAGKALVASGRVRVDGAVEMRKTCKVRVGQTVVVGETTIRVVSASPT